MPKYEVTFYFQAASVATIEAADAEEAINKAEHRGFAYASICAECSKHLNLSSDAVRVEVTDEDDVMVVERDL